LHAIIKVLTLNNIFTMRFNAPTKIVFWLAAVLVLLGLLGTFALVPALAPAAFWLVFAGYVVLALGNCLRGM
jgi:protein-S-isoprenylcysteine O-methyltransferase Ste14